MKRFGSETAFQVARDSNKFQDTRRGWAQSQNLENLLYPSARKYAHLSYFRQIESDTCGIKPSESAIEERIYGGSAAMPNSWPWVCLAETNVVSISLSFFFHIFQQVFYEEDIPCEDSDPSGSCTSNCGGSILNSRYVLTAAHCINKKDPNKIIIKAGLHNSQSDDEQEPRRQVKKIRRIIMHQGYNSETLENDLVILELADPLIFNDYVQPVCLPDSDVKTNSLLVVLGWGDEKAGSNALYLLKQSTATVMDACKNVDDYDKTKVFCIVDLTHKSSVCKGDSGGPALQKHGGRWVIEGVLSHGDDCKAEPGEYQNVFVRVFAYLPWINNIIDG
ncbi:unnamed protein product [Rotaria sp. Silwood2]|nr:unnamed protein product [Rotaria sp. Silwood2]CAF3389005.1 unnamed protein product [Rotaria sp. Silwood2]